MRVTNNHKRIIQQPVEKVSQLFKTLATTEDQIWPSQHWPAMRFKEGLKIGNKGGHGRIRYTIIGFEAGHHIKFKFSKPVGFNGTHELNVSAISEVTTEISHNITMNTTCKASLLWIFVIRWLHDALIEDAFDNVEHHFSDLPAEKVGEKKNTNYNFWVICLRGYYKRNVIKTKTA
ncbi:hypothetical protein WNY78_07390 [Psychroserpens sp. AS72]|uniref:hypothetical protein n=1 Tax=Psychroserpens sp. AS72 TaxID=3135775 RepID=UPI00317AD1F3